MNGTNLGSAIGPRRPNAIRTRSNSALPAITSTVTSQGREWKESKGKQAGHRSSRSVHHNGPYSLLSHHSNRRQTTAHLRHTTSDMVISPETTIAELSKKLGKLKDQSLSHSSSYDKRDASSAAPAPEKVDLAPLVAREKQRAKARNKEIQNVYQAVSEMSMESTRKLDDIYYSILERLSTLHSTITSLQELTIHNRDLRSSFDNDTQKLKNDISGQIASYKDFQDQQSQIDQLQARIKQSKGKSETLTERLDAARQRVRVLEDQEAEVQASISFQFRIVWFILGAFLTAIVAIFAAHHFFPTAHHEIQAAIETGLSSAFLVPRTSSSVVSNAIHHSLKDHTIPETSNISIIASSFSSLVLPESTCTIEDICTNTGAPIDDDPRLRLFDQL